MKNNWIAICNLFFAQIRMQKRMSSHGDYDYIGSSINLIDNFNIENVIFNFGTYNELEKDLIKKLKEKNIKYYKDIKELNINDSKLYFLNTGIYDNENDDSNVI